MTNLFTGTCQEMAHGLERLASCSRRYGWAGDGGLASAQLEGPWSGLAVGGPPWTCPPGSLLAEAFRGPPGADTPPSRSCWGYPKPQSSLCAHPKPTSTRPLPESLPPLQHTPLVPRADPDMEEPAGVPTHLRISNWLVVSFGLGPGL